MESQVLTTVEDANISRELAAVDSLPVFLQQKWFAVFQKYILDENQQPQILQCKLDDPARSAYMPFYTAIDKQLFRRRSLKCMTNYYSCIFSLINQGKDKVAINDFVQFNRQYLLKFDEIDINLIYEKEIQDYINAFENIGLSCFTNVESHNWYHDEIDSFETFHSNCSKNMRNNTRRAKVKLEKEEAFEITITCTEDLEQKLKDYHSVYEESWKHEESHPEFISEIARIAAKNDQLRLGLIYHDGFPIAAQMWFIDTHTAYIFKLAYREAYRARSVGNILTMDLCRHTIEKDGVTTIDFLTGNDPYKSKWMTKCRKQMKLKVTNPRRLFGAAIAAKENLSVMKKWVTG